MSEQHWSVLGPCDAIVLVMGLTGAGKSTFIERLTGLDAGIGHELMSETSQITVYPYVFGNRRVFFVDTPGFDDSRYTDIAIFKEISFYLSQIYKGGFRLAGMFYLHRITDNRVTASAMRSFQLAQKICGAQGAKFTRLVTTMWGEVPEGSDIYDLAVGREMELNSTEGYWGWMSDRGSRTQRYMDTRASALSILSSLLAFSDAQGPATFQLQQEIIDQDKEFDETAAGITLNDHYGNKWDRLKGELRALQTPTLQNPTASVFGSPQQLEEKKLDLQGQIRAAEVSERDLRQKLDSFFADKKERHRALFVQIEQEVCGFESKIETIRSDLQKFSGNSSKYEAELGHQSEVSPRTYPQDISSRSQVAPGERGTSSLPSGSRTPTNLYHSDESSFSHQQQNRLKSVKQPEYLLEAMSEEEKRQCLEKELARQEKLKIMKRNTLAVLGMLGGVATIAAGAATLQIPVVAAGIALFGSSGMKLDLHKKRKKVEEDKEWVVSEHN